MAFGYCRIHGCKNETTGTSLYMCHGHVLGWGKALKEGKTLDEYIYNENIKYEITNGWYREKKLGKEDVLARVDPINNELWIFPERGSGGITVKLDQFIDWLFDKAPSHEDEA